MPAKSKAQRRFMGMVTAMKHGSLKTGNLPKGVASKVKKAAKSMTKKQAKDFAKTKEKKLPTHVKESIYGTKDDPQSVATWFEHGSDAYDPDISLHDDVALLKKQGLSKEKLDAFIRGWNDAAKQDVEENLQIGNMTFKQFLIEHHKDK